MVLSKLVWHPLEVLVFSCVSSGRGLNSGSTAACDGRAADVGKDLCFLSQWQRQWKPFDRKWQDAFKSPRPLNRLPANWADTTAQGWPSLARLQKCHFEVVMVDSRRLPADEELASDRPMPYSRARTAVAVAINARYASKLGYEFRFVHVALNSSALWPGFAPEWHKLFYLAERVEEAAQAEPEAYSCRWLLYLDSDAWVHGYFSLAEMIVDLAARYRIREDVGLVVAMEQPKVGVHEPPDDLYWLNTGVLLVQVNENSRVFFRKWVSAAYTADRRFRHTFPREQGVLVELVVQEVLARQSRLLHAPTEAVAIVNMTEFNSPHGRYVRHFWGRGSQRPVIYRRWMTVDTALFAAYVKHVCDWATLVWAPGWPTAARKGTGSLGFIEQ